MSLEQLSKLERDIRDVGSRGNGNCTSGATSKTVNVTCQVL